ncbi:MAG: ribonuclease E/G, partial [Hyphomicrobiales bacterium]
MDNKMLFDATHPEETRVVVVRGNRVEEFDFEAENRKQLKGNIYLAKVTRVEPSLQAAFVDYGGNRHGFLAFSEIHPDYYQIPVADRQALLDEESAAHKASAIEEDEQSEKPKRRPRRRKSAAKAANTDDTIQSEIVDEPSNNEATEALESAEAAEVSEPVAADTPAPTDDDTEAAQSDADSETTADASADANNETEAKADNPKADDKNDSDDDSEETNQEDSVESVGSEDALEEVPERQSRPRAKHYKIQEVIKRRQIILVQVVKEERGNKGAALTTYLSLAGRYSVLMPNTDRGGGISRKITNQSDRKNLRAIANGLDVPEGMGVILRTAGASRTKTEINRDFEYLMRLWGNVRDLTLQSSAPALVYEEGSLLKRSIRDLYNKDINQVLVSGENGYREAKDFMR